MKSFSQKQLPFKVGKKELPIPWVLTSYMVFRSGTLEKPFDMRSLREMVNVEINYIARFYHQLVTGEVLQSPIGHKSVWYNSPALTTRRSGSIAMYSGVHF